MHRVLRQSLPHTSCPEGFTAPDFRTPIDLAASLARVPAHATGKGMFVAKLLAELDARGIPRPTDERFVPFTDYPLTRCMELNLEIARLLHPRVPDREALRRVAWRSFSIFAESMLGRMFFGAIGRDPVAALNIACRALPTTTNVGAFRIEQLDGEHALMHVTDTYLFAEPFGAGMIEGVLQACGRDGEVLVKMAGDTDAVFFLGLH
jgi:uncharacterized protein (TIGR02265 family)